MLVTEEHTTFAKVDEFSKVGIHRPSLSMKPHSDGYLDHTLRIYHEVWANGHDFTTEGFVSIVFTLVHFSVRLCGEVTVLISVIDTEDKRRFVRSFHYPPYNYKKQLIVNYISRSLLLNEPSEFLPNDTLTLRIDYVIQTVYREINTEDNETLTIKDDDTFIFKTEGCSGENSYYLYLDSPFAKWLCKESAFFDRMSDTPMIEGRSRWMQIPIMQEYVDLTIIEQILSGSLSVYDIMPFTLYETAHKYGLESILDFCRLSTQLWVSTDNVQRISSLAETYQDHHLTKIVETFQNQQSGDVQARANDNTTFFNFCGIEAETRDGYDFYK